MFFVCIHLIDTQVLLNIHDSPFRNFHKSKMLNRRLFAFIHFNRLFVWASKQKW